MLDASCFWADESVEICLSSELTWVVSFWTSLLLASLVEELFSDATSLCSVLTSCWRPALLPLLELASSLACSAITSATTPRIAARIAATDPKMAQKRVRSILSTRSLS